MVHKKYIKKGGKIFGPYLYENYRENGVTKTRYLGVAKKKIRSRKKTFLLAGIIFLILLFIGLFILGMTANKTQELAGELESKSPFDFLIKLFTTTSPVNVFVQINKNSPPEFLARPSEILVCEDTKLNYPFLVNDSDGDNLEFSFRDNLGITFYFNPNPIETGNILNNVNFHTKRDLTWNDIYRPGRRNDNEGWATYPETISVTDYFLVDSFDTNIVIIEVNNAPEFNIGARTIQTKGDGTNFYFDLGTYLINQGEETPKNILVYNLTYQNGSVSPFNISSLGVINVIGNESYIGSGENFTTYNLRLCVNDSGLQSISHQNLTGGFCLPEGDALPLRYCDNFSLTITKENRAPRITSYYPEDLTSKSRDTDVLYFNLTAYDPDWTPLDVYWYVDNASEGYYEGLEKENVSEFEYVFGCGISGNHTIKVVVSDGMLNDSLQWVITLEYVACPVPSTGGGGGGGGISRKLYCNESWDCDEWIQCQNLRELVEEGWASEATESIIRERCNILNYSDEICGFQTRQCTDFNNCKTEFDKPGDVRECYYTVNPNCTDNIKNCHDGSCEILTDCGGPCQACPTCHDNIQNQKEEGVDCGGPCNPCIELPWLPTAFKLIITYSLIILLIIVLLLISRQIIKYSKFKKIFGESRIKNLLIRKENKKVKNVVLSLLFIFFIIFVLFFANTYIMDAGQANKLISRGGILANYNFMNSIFNSFGLFFESGVFVNANSRLVLWDDTDYFDRFSICYEYCAEKNKPSSNVWTVHFYANYTDLEDNPLDSGSGGNCIINFTDLGGNMIYNGSLGLWEYTRYFNYKGDYTFDVSCSYNSLYNSGTENFSITNTVPYILKNAANFIDFDKNGDADTLLCSEDSLCIYNFSANVSEDDANDLGDLYFDYSLTGNTTLTDFSINSSTGILEININKGIFTGNKKIELNANDGEMFDSAVLKVYIQEVNDAPVFLNLENKTFNERDLFEHIIDVSDEENNYPFKFNISFVSCSNLGTRGNCTLFDYNSNEINGEINISFIPLNLDVGSYLINFSVMDNSSLGNKMTSQIINFIVTPAIWKGNVTLDYLLTEDEGYFINLTESIIEGYQGAINFSYNPINSSFPSFNLQNGIINMTPTDSDVGYNRVEITANSQGLYSSRIFNFTVLNINDSLDIISLTGNNVNINPITLKVWLYENADASLILSTSDDDFLIPQKSFYDENLTLNLSIEGPNPGLFNFAELGLAENTMEYKTEFSPTATDTGDYNVTINIRDANNFSSDILKFDLTVIERNYNQPNITYPGDPEFNMKENITSELIFRSYHTVGDNLRYSFYIDRILRASFLGSGNDTNVSWLFAPNFTDETYNGASKLTLVVSNPYYSDLFTTRSWNLSINHTNAPPKLIHDIGDKSTTYNNRIEIDLSEHFTDVDYYDAHYNQSFTFNISSNLSSSNIARIKGDSEWKIVLLPVSQAYTKEILNVIMSDLNNTEKLNNISSNNFTIEFTRPETVQVPAPSSGGGSSNPIALKIIVPGQISAYEGDILTIPIRLVNSGSRDFNDISLNSSAFKNSSLFNEIKTSLDKTYFKTLKPKQEENITLTVELGASKIGKYEILVEADSKSPKYSDWGKIYLDLMPINESQVRDLIIFTEEIIAGNPQCVEITEIIKEAEAYFQAGDYNNAKLKANEALDSCREAINQLSLPRSNVIDFIKSLRLSSYLFLAIIGTIAIAIILGVIYYFIKRKKIENLHSEIQEAREDRDTKI